MARRALRLVEPLAGDPELESDRGVPPRRLFPARAVDLDAEPPQPDPHLLQDRHHVGPGTGGGREEQGEHRTRRLRVVPIDDDGGTVRSAAPEDHVPLPVQGDVLDLLAHRSAPPTRRSAAGATRW